ncbi:hypothetical protein LCGC14_2796220 [marine sediment metagenome]|uniref:Uncharacterized protein n=1 Tax=marine sediment metagenome TaxID=412755 RepID=A0A0F8ZB42_9ZZZZ
MDKSCINWRIDMHSGAESAGKHGDIPARVYKSCIVGVK